MSDNAIRDRLLALAEANLQLQQHGQMNDGQVHDGRTACTHAVCQFLSLAWNGTMPTLNEVNRLAGMKPNATDMNGNPRGMRQSELETFLKNAKIPMKVVRGMTFKNVLAASNNGPVFYGMRYGSAPARTMRTGTQRFTSTMRPAPAPWSPTRMATRRSMRTTLAAT